MHGVRNCSGEHEWSDRGRSLVTSLMTHQVTDYVRQPGAQLIPAAGDKVAINWRSLRGAAATGNQAVGPTSTAGMSNQSSNVRLMSRRGLAPVKVNG